MITAELICDSISHAGIRLSTLKLRYPRFIHSEFMTHRLFSRNASSSRAVPAAKLIEEVRSDALRAAPIFWGKNQSGMQAAEELSDVKDGTDIGGEYSVEMLDSHDEPSKDSSPRERAVHQWQLAAYSAAVSAERLTLLGAHKQIVNRILEPFTHINVLVSATDFDNFFGLRLDKMAQPEMQELARQMYAAREVGGSQMLQPGQWHLPFLGEEDSEELTVRRHWLEPHQRLELARKVSVARCARVSYESFETGKRSTIEEDLKLYDRLLGSQPIHASPAEHQATPDTLFSKPGHLEEFSTEWEHGNFRGWRQFRKMLPNESCAPLPEEFR